jgi:cytochrome b6-f complex iron-sulfur subunit
VAKQSGDQEKLPGEKRAAEPGLAACATGRCSRRQWLRRVGWFGVFTPLLGMAACTVRLFFPRVLFEPSPIFKAGFPEEYPIGMVNTKYKAKYGVWIVRESDRVFYALLAVCTHLGCIPVWFVSEDRFKCPCHGTTFTREGINYEGPAPRPLERVKISLADDGQILIDKRTRFREEKREWGDPGAVLEV